MNLNQVLTSSSKLFRQNIKFEVKGTFYSESAGEM